MAGRQQALGGEREYHRRDEPLGKSRDRIARTRLKRAAACPDERAAGALEQSESAVDLRRIESRVQTLDHPRGV
jgi:hypothetical protein